MFGIRNRKRLQQDGIDERENGCRGSDAKRQRQNGCCRESGVFAQRSQRIASVPRQMLEPERPAHIAALFLRNRHAMQLSHGRMPRLSSRQTASDTRLGLPLKVISKLFVKFPFDCRPPE